MQGLAEQDQSLRALRLRRAELSEDIRRLAIRAPVAGRVLALAVLAPGAVLRPAEILARITPDQPPQVALHLPAHLGARIHPGQSVELVSPRQGAGPPSHLRGTISLISADTLTDPTSGEAFYRVLVLPEILPDVPPDVISGTMPAPGDTLRPGQPVEAFIETGQQSAFAWLIAPLRLHLARALRET